MSVFAKKKISEESDEVAELEDNIGTMQDDVATVMTNKNRGGKVLTSYFKRVGGRTKEIQRDLTDVYTSADGEIPDLTKLDKGDRPLWQTILYTLTAVFAVLFVASIVGFLVFSNLNNQSFTNEKVLFKVEPPISIVAGQEQEYTIIVSNKEKVNLYNLNIDLLYPDAFEYVSGTPEATGERKNLWDFSVLKVGETKEIKFRAKISAALNTVSTLSGTLMFKPENLNADFKQKVSVDLGINSSVVVLAMEGPDRTLANQKVEYIAKLRNIGAEKLKDLEVSVEYPAGFVPASSTSEFKEGSNNTWIVPELATSTDATATSSEKRIVIKGDFSATTESGNKEMKFRVNSKKGGSYVLMAEQSIVTEVVKDSLELSLVINGSGEDQSVGFGDLLFYTLSYKNAGHDELKNIELSAALESEVLDWTTLLDDNKGKVRGSTMTWTGKEVSQLLTLRPGEQGEVSWQIRLKDLDSLNGEDVSKYSVENTATAKVKLTDGSTSEIKSKTIISSINSDLSLKAQARYYNEDNVALGAGSIQPKAGEASSYNIKLSLSNNLHDIGVIEVSALLPKNVNWDNKVNMTAGEVSYNKTNRKIIWKISRLAKTAKGTSADFNVSITPQESDIGRVLILLPEIKLVAKDLDTGADISKSVKAITTSFDDPILGQVSGVVD
jgi:hypothetical protein